MITLNKRLIGFVIVISCLSVVLCSGCLSELKEDFLTYRANKQDAAKEVTTPPPSPQQNITREAPPLKQEAANVLASDQQGKGYLKDGSTVSLGVLDGDEELKVLEKVKKIEKELNREIKKREIIEESLVEMKAAKSKVEEEFIITKRELEEVIKNLSEDIKSLDIQKKELKEKAVAAVQQTEKLKEEILSSQIAETKARQELYKLKIERLEEEQEEP